MAFSVTDRFVDYGLVGALLIKGSCIVQFVMSCRVLGMEIERAAVANVVALVRRHNLGTITAPLQDTQDNTACHDVYTKLGFRASEEPDQGSLFVLAPNETIESPVHIKIAGDVQEGS